MNQAQRKDLVADTPFGYPIVRVERGVYSFRMIPQNGFVQLHTRRCRDDREAYETAKSIDARSRYYFLDTLPDPIVEEE